MWGWLNTVTSGNGRASASASSVSCGIWGHWTHFSCEEGGRRERRMGVSRQAVSFSWPKNECSAISLSPEFVAERLVCPLYRRIHCRNLFFALYGLNVAISPYCRKRKKDPIIVWSMTVCLAARLSVRCYNFRNLSLNVGQMSRAESPTPTAS